MENLIVAVRDKLAANSLGHPVAWENTTADSSLPRFQVQIGPEANSAAMSFDGLSKTDLLIQIDCLVEKSQGLASQLYMIAEINELFAIGETLADYQVVARPQAGPPIAFDEVSYSRPVTVKVRGHF